MNIFGKIFKQTFWQIIGKVVTSVSTFIILGIVARNYKEDGTGVFTLMLTYLSMFFLLGDFGFNAHVLKKITDTSESEKSNQWRRLLGVRIFLSILLILSAILLAHLLPFKHLNLSAGVLWGSIAILGSSIFITGNLIFQQKLKYNLSVLSSSIGAFFYLVLVLFFSSKNLALPYLLLAFAAGWLATGLSAIFFVKKFERNIVPIFDFNFTKKLIKDSWPIAATLGVNVVYFRADSFMLAYFKNASDVGIYNLAYQIFQGALVFPAFIMNAYYPLMLKSLDNLKHIAAFLLALGTFGFLSVFFLSKNIVNILSGGGFVGSSESLQILSFGFPAYFLSALFMFLMVAKGDYKKMLIIYTSGMILNLVLNFIFIPKYSFYASSWNTVLSEYFILIIQIFILRKVVFK